MSSLNMSFHSFASDFSVRSNESWVPTGVDFSPSMEVYVYERD